MLFEMNNCFNAPAVWVAAQKKALDSHLFSLYFHLIC